jgi:hypothetical protein
VKSTEKRKSKRISKIVKAMKDGCVLPVPPAERWAGLDFFAPVFASRQKVEKEKKEAGKTE